MSNHTKHRKQSWLATLAIDGLLSLITTMLVAGMTTGAAILAGIWRGWNQRSLSRIGLLFLVAMLICILHSVTRREQQNLTARKVISLAVMVLLIGIYDVWYVISGEFLALYIVIPAGYAASYGLNWAMIKVWESWVRRQNRSKPVA